MLLTCHYPLAIHRNFFTSTDLIQLNEDRLREEAAGRIHDSLLMEWVSDPIYLCFILGRYKIFITHNTATCNCF